MCFAVSVALNVLQNSKILIVVESSKTQNAFAGKLSLMNPKDRNPSIFHNHGTDDKNIKNPYFGNSMLKCGEIIDEIK